MRSRMAIVCTMAIVATTLGGTAFAATEPPPVLPSIVGTWALSGIECSSGTPLTGGIKIGQDTLSIIYLENHTFTKSVNRAGCVTGAKGTFKLEGSILATTMTESQSCGDASPIPINESKTAFIAHLDDERAVSITTGTDAAYVCPGGDALVMTYSRRENSRSTQD